MLYLPRSIQADYLDQPLCELKNPPPCDFPPTATGERQAPADGGHRRRDLAVRLPGRALSTRPGTSSLRSVHLRNADGSFHTVDGIPHFLSHAAAAAPTHPRRDFDLVWASGWEEKAEEYLPRLLGLPAGLPFLSFERSRGAGRSIDGHWKLDAIDTYAGMRPLAWIDDAFDESCHAWATARTAPTLLVQTSPAVGLTAAEAHELTDRLLAKEATQGLHQESDHGRRRCIPPRIQAYRSMSAAF